MCIEPVPVEMVCYEERQILKDHFNLMYVILAEEKLIPEAVFEKKEGLTRCLSGIPFPFHNVVIGPACIEEQIAYFAEAKMPFAWYVDEESDPEFKEKLMRHGFQDGGIFRGVIGMLEQPIPNPVIPEGCKLALVQTEYDLEAFNELVCSTFGIEGISKDRFKKVLWSAYQKGKMFHWIAWNDGKAVSALSTLVDGDVVSFWNGASSPDMRRLGLSTALRCLALQHAASKECRMGASYLMAEGLAFGICTRFGFKPKWLFHVYIK